VLRERMLAMKAIWTADEASFHGAHVSFDAPWSWPTPQRAGGSKIIVGGHRDGVLERVQVHDAIGRLGEQLARWR
jgi:alkanesulfonate monooxygenase SsuD/methylene tetrahydromethanopterin reductase-like flavin-dependent oxidoreductase (luciferase family)